MTEKDCHAGKDKAAKKEGKGGQDRVPPFICYAQCYGGSLTTIALTATRLQETSTLI